MCIATIVVALECRAIAQCSEMRIDRVLRDRISERSYLFTISDIEASHTPREPFDSMAGAEHVLCEQAKSRLVEPDGIEPTTSCLQSRRSPN